MSQEFSNYISGQWVAAGYGKTFAQRNPADLDEVTGIWPACSRDDANRAIDAAGLAFPGWRALTAAQRAGYLKEALNGMHQRRAELAEIMTRENGKTLRESHAEIDSALREMEYQIGEGV
ncbi:MAG TPA: aldehyde dehydrogenase family protein, partial [Clostridiales bacterium]|nr:aldehyde dehydrogenase family protein [Clostridiales bacterium]